MATTSRRLTAALLASTLGSGCSWVFMTRPPSSPPGPGQPLECTSSRTAPVLDTICAGYFVANGIVWVAARSCDSAAPGEKCYSSSAKSTGVAVSAGLAALCGISAVSGYGYSSRCQEMQSARSVCITGTEPACARPYPGWTPAGAAPPPTPPPALPGPAVPPAPPGSQVGPTPTAPGCGKDTDCKGDRICEKGECVDPRPRGEPPGR